jgi:23S rRNA pseudouridine1911/1915/1917 synthase
MPARNGGPIEIEVSDGESGVRLDRLLAGRIDELGGRAAGRLVRDGAVTVNGRPAAKGRRLDAGDVVRVDGSRIDASTGEFLPTADPETTVEVLHRDARVLVVEKRAGVHTAPLRPGDRGTLVSAVLAIAPEAGRVRGFQRREGGLVHRLDRATSGACLFALDQDAFDGLRAATESDRVIKSYLAVVEGRVLDGPPTLEAVIPRGERGGRRVRVSAVRRIESRDVAPRRGAGAERLVRTGLSVRERAARHSLVELTLSRGHRHQVRSVLQALGHPVAGDPLYGRGSSGPRMLLHASRIAFPHPDDGRSVRVESPASDLLEAWRDLSRGRAPSLRPSRGTR